MGPQCLQSCLCCGCRERILTSHHVSHDRAGADTAGLKTEYAIVQVSTAILMILLYRSSETYRYTEEDIKTVWKLEKLYKKLSKKTLDKVRGLGFDFISSIALMQWYCLSGNSYCSGEYYSGCLHLNDRCKYEWLWDEATSEVSTVLSLGLKPNPLSQTVTLTLAVTLILALNLNQWAFLSSD